MALSRPESATCPVDAPGTFPGGFQDQAVQANATSGSPSPRSPTGPAIPRPRPSGERHRGRYALGDVARALLEKIPVRGVAAFLRIQKPFLVGPRRVRRSPPAKQIQDPASRIPAEHRDGLDGMLVPCLVPDHDLLGVLVNLDGYGELLPHASLFGRIPGKLYRANSLWREPVLPQLTNFDTRSPKCASEAGRGRSVRRRSHPPVASEVLCIFRIGIG